MTDRELLEAAAKAARFGDGKFCWTESEYPRGSGKSGALWNYVGHMESAELWNPLTDDGDALRLAVTLSIHITMNKFGAAASGPSCGTVENGPDVLAATRRAIVRAAAASVTQLDRK